MRNAVAWIQGALLGCGCLLGGCASPPAEAATGAAAALETAGQPAVPPPGAVGLALEVENGVGTPLLLRAGQTYWLDQLDLRAFLDTSVDEGVAGLDRSGDFAALPWSGVTRIEQEPQP